jgi:hypothetical protein
MLRESRELRNSNFSGSSVFDAARSLLFPGSSVQLRDQILEAILLPRELGSAWKEATTVAEGLAIFAAFLNRLGIRWHCEQRDLAMLSDAISDLEPDGKGLPVLLRQYLNLGGTMIAFNEDPRFSGVIDGLVVVDLRRLNHRLLAKYLGKAGAEVFC